ncbi:hypothetical protein DFH06DRAFT_1234593 [Mycena polygramma]|nr:hypothetical protein DFH06DRAFT_1234593 [Mycena polygramma]
MPGQRCQPLLLCRRICHLRRLLRLLLLDVLLRLRRAPATTLPLWTKPHSPSSSPGAWLSPDPLIASASASSAASAAASAASMAYSSVCALSAAQFLACDFCVGGFVTACALCADASKRVFGRRCERRRTLTRTRGAGDDAHDARYGGVVGGVGGGMLERRRMSA